MIKIKLLQDLEYNDNKYFANKEYEFCKEDLIILRASNVQFIFLAKCQKISNYNTKPMKY